MKMRFNTLCAIGALSLCGSTAFAQLSDYYVTDGTAGLGSTHIWQGGSAVGNYQWAANGEMPIAVGDFGSGVRIRQAVGEPLSGSPEQGDEYLLNGTATGFHNTWNMGNSGATAYDAAYNGSSIFMVDWGGATSGAVYQYDNNYGSRTFLFNANTGDIGITYDTKDQTLWTSNFSNGLVQEWSMNGTALTSFTAAGGSAAALAYDSLDGSLWMSDGFNRTNILNYSTSGALLQSVNTNEYLLGGEMAAVPEPATMILLGAGGVALLRRRR